MKDPGRVYVAGEGKGVIDVDGSWPEEYGESGGN